MEDVITPTRAGFELAANYLKVLGHPARLQILHFIREDEESVTSIQKFIQLTQAMTSQHLKVLYATGLIERRRGGTSIYYRLSQDIGQKLLGCLHSCPTLWFELSDTELEDSSTIV